MPKKTFFNLPDYKKDNIVNATYEIFIHNKYEDVTIRDIAKEAEISIGSFYQYFDDKDELYLFLLTRIEKKIYAKLKEKYGTLFFEKEIMPLEQACTPQEIAFDRTFYDVPVEVMMKFYFGDYGKDFNSFVMDELKELKEDGRLKDCVDIDLIFYHFVTSMFNMQMYFREKNITDDETKIKLKTNFYLDIFLTGILKNAQTQSIELET